MSSFVDDECDGSGPDADHVDDYDYDFENHTADAVEDDVETSNDRSFYRACDNARVWSGSELRGASSRGGRFQPVDPVDWPSEFPASNRRAPPVRKRRSATRFSYAADDTSESAGGFDSAEPTSQSHFAPKRARKRILVASDAEEPEEFPNEFGRSSGTSEHCSDEEFGQIAGSQRRPRAPSGQNNVSPDEVVALELTSGLDGVGELRNLQPEAKLRVLWPKSVDHLRGCLEMLCVLVGKLLATLTFSEVSLANAHKMRAFVRYFETLEATLSSCELAGTFRASFFKHQQRNAPLLAESNLEFIELLDADVFADTALLPADGSRDELVQRLLRVKLLVKQHGAGHSGCTLIAENRGAESSLQYPMPPLTYALDSKQYKKPCQLLLNYVLNCAYARRLKMYVDGIYTRAGASYYQRLATFPEFIWSCVGGQAQSPEEYGWATTGETTINHTAYSLSNCLTEPRLPVIKWSRTHFSFNNGVLDADGVVFYWDVPYVDSRRYRRLKTLSDLDPAISCPGHFDTDYPVNYHLSNSDPDFPFPATPPLRVEPNEGEPEELTYLKHLPANDPATEEFLNNPVFQQYAYNPAEDNYFDPLAIPTPAWDTITDAQKWDKPTCLFFRALLGRTVFNIGQKDGWQLLLVMWGTPGVGKSVVLDKWRQIYDEVHVGTMMSDVEQTFSDGHLMDTFIQILPDLVKNKGNQPALNEHRWKSYATGESVTCFYKGKKPVTKKWNSNTVIATNFVPPWSDAAFVRRLAIFLMEHPVPHGDATLEKRCHAELPLFLVSCLLAYELTTRLFGSFANILSMGFLPDHVRRGSREYSRHICILQSFLASKYVTYEPGKNLEISTLNNYVRKYAEHINSKEMKQYRNFTYSAVAHNHIVLQNPGLSVEMEDREVTAIRGCMLSQLCETLL